MNPYWEVLELQDKVVGVISLPANAPDKPYKAKRGSAWVTKIRVGTTTRNATREEEGRLYQQSGQLRYGLKPVSGRLNSQDVLARLAELCVARGLPEHIRSDNGPEFAAKAVRRWLGRVGVQTLFIEPGSPWENGYIESFNGKLRDEFLNLERFDTLLEAQVLIERWRLDYNLCSAINPSGRLSLVFVG